MKHEALTLLAIEQRLHARFKEGFLTLKELPQPHLFKDMQKATARIVSAIEAKESIVLIGDYDVDGVNATAIVKHFFNEINYPLTWIIPNRFRDGYGLSAGLIPRIEGHSLAITVDNGIAAVEAATLCKERGIDLIITDHHLLPPTLPDAYAIIDQKQPDCPFPYKEICGAQIAWYLCASLNKALGSGVKMMEYMDLVAVATIADVMPLRHINRPMVQAGLQVLAQTQRAAFRAFREMKEQENFTAEDIAFSLAPLINSAGRMEDASYAVEFLLSGNIYDARVRLERLVAFNEARKAEEMRITKEAQAASYANDAVAIAVGEGWHEGVLGIVASRLAEQTKKPAIVLTKQEDGTLKGSGRNDGKCDLFSLLSNSRSLFTKFGGHAAAVGLSMPSEDLEALRMNLQTDYEAFKDGAGEAENTILGELPFSEISFALTALLKRYEPFGEGNPHPRFLTRSVEILQAERMGKEREHMRFLFRHNNTTHVGVKFRCEDSYCVGECVEIIYRVNENRFRGNVTLQLMIDEIKS